MNDDRSRAVRRAARRIFGARADFYRDSPAHSDPAVLARLVQLAAPRPDWLALDLATGTGHTAHALAPHVRRVVGLDLTPEMLAHARLPAPTPAILLCQGDAHRLPFPDGRFDLVVCRRAAHHFADLPAALKEIRRLLPPGGRLVIDDRSVPEDPGIDRLMNRLDRLHDPSHVRQAPPSEWIGLLQGGGFEVQTLEPYRRLRPLSDLFPEDQPSAVVEIHRLVEGLTEETAAALGRVRRDGEWHIHHWYVILAARRS